NCPPSAVTTSLQDATVTTPLTLYVMNQGALPVTALGEGTPPSAPFAWAGGAFPGGVGSVGTYPYCSATSLGVGEQCVVTVSFSPTVVGNYAGAVSLAYSDAMGPVLPDANRNIQGSCSDLPPNRP